MIDAQAVKIKGTMSKVTAKVTRSNIFVPMEMSRHKEYIHVNYEICMTYSYSNITLLL